MDIPPSLIVLIVVGVVGWLTILTGGLTSFLDQLGRLRESWRNFREPRGAPRVSPARGRETGIQLPPVRPSAHVRRRPDLALLSIIRDLTFELQEGYHFDETGHFYVDTMGGVFDPDLTPRLDTIFDAWVHCLEERGIIQAPEYILASKDGNPFLVRQYATYNEKSGVGVFHCKGRRDSARVRHVAPSMPPHHTDFEGLGPFQMRIQQEISPGTTISGIAADDNCTGGNSIRYVMQNFNLFLAGNPGLPFEPVRDAVVLFAIRSENREREFTAAGFALHAMFEFGKEDLQVIAAASDDELKQRAASFRHGHGTEAAKRIFGNP